MSVAWENAAAKDNETQRFSTDSSINDKIKTAVAGLQKCIQDLFLEFPTDKDKELVADFINACIKQENISMGTRRAYLVALARLSGKVAEGKSSFEQMSSKDLTTYLNDMQRNHAQDPDQSWINTQRAYGEPLVKFFKWLAYPDLTPQERRHLTRDKYPAVLKGMVIQTKKGSRSPIKAKHIWNDQDIAMFLKYCNDNPRLRFYHALAYETSGRPGELLQLKIGDIQIDADSDGKLYAALDIGRDGKKKQSRIVGITDFSIQYYQAYLSKTHPDSTNKQAFIFVSRERSAYTRNVPISGDALRADYFAFRDKTIPKLLKRPDIPQQDKKHLQLLMDQKKWNPYTLRHSSITTLARHPKINDYILRQHAGWSKRSDMVEIYTHELKGDSLEYVMEARGINIKTKRDRSAQLLRDEQIGPYCPYCKMVNVPNTQFCSSCQRPITQVSYDTIIREAENVKKELAELKAVRENDRKAMAELLESRQKQIEDRIQQMEEMQEEIFNKLVLKHNPPLNQIKSKKKRNAVETKLMLEAGELAGIGVEEE